MKYLLPSGGNIERDYGVLVTPGMRGIPRSIKNGWLWAADNQAYTKRFDLRIFLSWLKTMRDYLATCLFVACPDVVGNATETLSLFWQYHHNFIDWPIAFVGQDGQENMDFPPSELWQCLFIGGTTRWKVSAAAIECIYRAQNLGKHIHIGRVNYYRRYQHFARLNNSERFTCDGTRIRYERTKALKDWKKYMLAPRQLDMFISGSYSRREFGNN